MKYASSPPSRSDAELVEAVHMPLEDDISRSPGADAGNQPQHLIGLSARYAVVEQVVVVASLNVCWFPLALRGKPRWMALPSVSDSWIVTKKMCHDLVTERGPLRLAQEVRIFFG